MRTYLDWNATTPLRPEVKAAMVEAMEIGGNPSSVHTEGRAAKMALERAREQVEHVTDLASTDATGAIEAFAQLHPADRAEVVAELEGRRQVQGIEAPEHHGFERAGSLTHGGRQVEKGHRVEDRPGLPDLFGRGPDREEPVPCLRRRRSRRERARAFR